jgi:HSP20 family protein
MPVRQNVKFQGGIMFNLAKRNENPITAWQNEMRNFFDRFNREFSIDIDMPLMTDFAPKIEVKDSDKGYLVSAEVPGMTEKDINVSLKDNSLIIEGERKTESKTEDQGRFFSEFEYGSFYRSIPLNDEVDANKVKATYRDGVLSVELVKAESSAHKAKRIPVSLQ